MVDSIAVSLSTNSIRRQDPNIYSDTDTRALSSTWWWEADLLNGCDWKFPCMCSNCQMYLSKLPNVFFKIAKCIFQNCQMYLSKFAKCICPIWQMYLSNFPNVCVQICRGTVQWKMEHRGSMEDMGDMGEQFEREEEGWVSIDTLPILTFIFLSKRFQIVWIGESLAQ